jgi:hypothetical protein
MDLSSYLDVGMFFENYTILLLMLIPALQSALIVSWASFGSKKLKIKTYVSIDLNLGKINL